MFLTRTVRGRCVRRNLPSGRRHFVLRRQHSVGRFRQGNAANGDRLRALDEDMSTEECQVAFDEIDLNRDGSIDFDDFVAWWTNRA
jgi:hypothetical protein